MAATPHSIRGRFMSFRRMFSLVLLIVSALVPATISPAQAAITKSEQVLLTGLQRRVDVSANLYKAGDFARSAVRLNSAQKYLEKILEKADEEFLAAIEPQYKRMQKAHALLSGKGQNVDDLPELRAGSSDDSSAADDRTRPARRSNRERTRRESDDTARNRRQADDDNRETEEDTDEEAADDERQSAATPTAATTPKPAAASTVERIADVRFTNHIAPLLVRNCGSCHIEQTKGDFSLVTFADLMNGGESGEVMIPGNAAESKLVQLIRDKKMPPRKGLPSEQLELIERWVSEGANFDGDDDGAELAALVEATDADATDSPSTSTARPTSDQAAQPATVSTPATANAPVEVRFSRDIAPILVASCADCHIREHQGEFSVATFSDLMTGGESGEVILAGESSESKLLQLVSDKKMPPRKGLPPEQVDLIRRWIDAGAPFDGSDDGAELTSLLAPNSTVPPNDPVDTK